MRNIIETIVHNPLLRLFTILMITAMILLCTIAEGQTNQYKDAMPVYMSNPSRTEIESTVVRAVTLRELIGESRDYHMDLAYFLGMYFDIKVSEIRNDNGLKNQLITSFVQEAQNHGYKIPKHVTNKDPFEPYIWIVDLPIAFNRLGYMIPAEKFHKQIEGTGKVIGRHEEKVVFDHMID